MTTQLTETPENEVDAPASTTNRMRWIKRGVIGVVVLVALVYGAIFFYANVLNDAPDALDSTDLSEALAEPSADADVETDSPASADDATEALAVEQAPVEEVAVEEAPAEEAPAEEAVAEEAPAEEAVAEETAAEETATAGFDGAWTPTTASEFGYRVEEVLAGVNTTAVGRSNEIDGSLTIDGTTASIEVSVQVASITSDDGRRDGQFRGRVMDAANFPTATFRTTSPIDFGAIPSLGEQITATATGELTLKGSTQPVEFDITAQADGDSIGVLGNIPVTFSDYGIDNPSNAGVKTEDDGLLEFVLVFEQT